MKARAVPAGWEPPCPELLERRPFALCQRDLGHERGEWQVIERAPTGGYSVAWAFAGGSGSDVVQTRQEALSVAREQRRRIALGWLACHLIQWLLLQCLIEELERTGDCTLWVPLVKAFASVDVHTGEAGKAGA